MVPRKHARARMGCRQMCFIFYYVMGIAVMHLGGNERVTLGGRRRRRFLDLHFISMLGLGDAIPAQRQRELLPQQSDCITAACMLSERPVLWMP
mmetsp:Transcript_397/g.927  ORF Transcript_397/g.927 Transcript_397/m.927 type:complete len:94 (-) Transcript_397:465-746(-)